MHGHIAANSTQRILAGKWLVPTTAIISFSPDGYSMQDQQIIHQTGNGSFIENEVNRRFEPGLVAGRVGLLLELAVLGTFDGKSHAGKGCR